MRMVSGVEPHCTIVPCSNDCDNIERICPLVGERTCKCNVFWRRCAAISVATRNCLCYDCPWLANLGSRGTSFVSTFAASFPNPSVLGAARCLMVWRQSKGLDSSVRSQFGARWLFVVCMEIQDDVRRRRHRYHSCAIVQSERTEANRHRCVAGKDVVVSHT